MRNGIGTIPVRFLPSCDGYSRADVRVRVILTCTAILYVVATVHDTSTMLLYRIRVRYSYMYGTVAL